MKLKKVLSTALITALAVSLVAINGVTTAFASPPDTVPGTYSIGDELRQNRNYRFANRSSNKDLNFFYSGGGSNVDVWTEDGTEDQAWYLLGDRLYSEHTREGNAHGATIKCLDRYVGSDNYNNADMWQANDAANQLLDIKVVALDSTYGPYVTIRLQSNGYYLTQSGSNVIWTQNKNGTLSEWLAERLIRKTGVTSARDGNIDFFTNNMTDENGNYVTQQDGVIPQTWKVGAANLYKLCFKKTGTESQYLYNMYGCLYGDIGNATYNGKFHTGIDMSASANSTVYSPVSGTVAFESTNYGEIAIKPDGANYYVVMLHMSNHQVHTGDRVSKGQPIGTMNGVGAGGSITFAPHLHVEISTGTGMINATNNSNKPLQTGSSRSIYPYNIFSAM